jgi:amino acid adenylation domain-containing protein
MRLDELTKIIADLTPEEKILLEETLLGGQDVIKTEETIISKSSFEPAPLSFSQSRLWFLDQYNPGKSIYNIAVTYNLKGVLNISALRKSLQAIVRRHEVLRTTYGIQNDHPVQIVYPNFDFNLTVTDLRKIPDAEREPAAWKLIQTDSTIPFNLTKSVFRAKLLQLSAENNIFYCVYHHIATDGWSRGIFDRELQIFYAAFSAGENPSLPDLDIQYSDYAVWQREWLRGNVLAELLDYWKQHLAGASTLELPLDRPRPPVQTYPGTSQSFQISSNLTQKLIELGKKNRSTLFMTLLAIFYILLRRYSGQTDICVGAPVANRTRTEIEDLIGFFVNTLVFRTSLSGNPAFSDLLQRVRETALEAYSYQTIPFEKLVSELNIERDVSRSPLFQIMFSLENIPRKQFHLSGLDVECVEVKTGFAMFDLHLTFKHNTNGLQGEFIYNSDLFKPATISRMGEHFKVLLAGILTNPNQPIGYLPLLTAQEKKRHLVHWNDTYAHISPELCVQDRFTYQAQKTPDDIAVIYKERQITYQELDHRSTQLAQRLRAMRVGPEILVGIGTSRSLEMVIGLLGILKAGGAYVPIDPALPKERANFILEDSRIPILLTDKVAAPLFSEYSGNILLLDAARDQTSFGSQENTPATVGTKHLAYVMYTSGSSGWPKGVAIQHQSVNAFLNWASELFSSQDLAGVLAGTSLSFDLSVFEIFLPLIRGGQVIIVDSILDLADENIAAETTLINTVPAGIKELLTLAAIPDQVQTINLAGEPLTTELVAELYGTGNINRVYDFYGPTEDTTYSTGALRSSEGPATIGRPIQNTQIYLLDGHLQPVPVGVIGEIFIGGAGLGRGYFNLPHLTAEKFIPNPFSIEPGERLFKTGDLARYWPDGQLEFIGRADSQVKIRGYRIELGEIEAVLTRHPEIRAAVVLAKTDRDGQKRLVGYIATELEKSVFAEQINSYLQPKLPGYMLPSDWVLLEALPQTPNGKLDRLALEKIAAPSASSMEPYVAPSSPLEKKIADIWAKVLAVPQIGIHDNFFELGGHSLLATQVVSRIRTEIDPTFLVRTIFEAPTIAGAVTHSLRQGFVGEPLADSGIKPALRARDLPLSFAQQRLWFLDQYEPDLIAYNLPTAFRVSGSLDQVALEKSLLEIIRRHETLRTTYAVRNGQPSQIITPNPSLGLSVIDLQSHSAIEPNAHLQKELISIARQPFDLTTQVFNAVLLKLGPEDHAIIINIHHIATDGWSQGLFFKELSTLYAVFASGEKSPLPDLPLQYFDYAIWQKAWLQGDELDAQLRYWERKLADLPIFDLPADYPRLQFQSYDGARYQFTIPGELSDSFIKFCIQENATLFMGLLAVLNILMQRYSGQDDIVVGSPIANRNREDIEELIGFFVNTLVLRSQLSDEFTFKDLLSQVRTTALEAYSNQDLPFEMLVEALNPARDLSRNPLFQVLFAVQNAPHHDLSLPGLKVDPIQLDTATTHFDLELHFSLENEGLRGSIFYNTAIFSPQRIERFGKHFINLVQAILTDPQAEITQYPLLTKLDQEQLIRSWRGNPKQHDSVDWIQTQFEAYVAKTPAAVAVIGPAHPDDFFNNQNLTYQELETQSNQLAWYLQRLGIGPDVFVGMYVEPSIEVVVGVLAILKAGGAYFPMDPSYPQDRLAYMAADTQAKYILTQQHLIPELPPNSSELICLDNDWDQISLEPKYPPKRVVAPDNLIYVLYTSGSTGKPKGVVMTYRAMINLISWELEHTSLPAGAKMLQFSPLSFDASFVDIFIPLCSGGAVYILPDSARKDPEQIAAEIIENGLERLNLPYAALHSLSSVYSDLGNYPDKLGEIFSTAEQLKISPLVRKFFHNLPNCELQNQYGPTETHVVTAKKMGPNPNQWPEIPSIGRPINNSMVLILDDLLRPVPFGIPGNLYISGDNLARGYLNRPELTAERFIPNPFSENAGARMYKTGDIARYLDAGDLEFLGRKDFQIKLRGYRIELGEIETVIYQFPGVKDVVVVTWGETYAEKRLIAYLVLKQPENFAIEKLRGHLKKRLTEYMLPAAFVILPILPLTPTGKIDRRSLPEPDHSRPAMTVDYLPPQTGTDQKLVAIWEAILGVENIGINDNFFDLGGNSLLATQVVSRIRKTTQVEMGLKSFFENPTIADLGQMIFQASKNNKDAGRVITSVKREKYRRPNPRPENEL